MEAIRLVGEGGLDRDEAAALAARDDLAAFAPLYEAHRDAVYRYLRARSRTEDDAVELTAVTFERALGAIHRYAPKGGGVLAWLLRIARNAAIDYERRRRPWAGLFGLEARPDPDPTPDQVAVRTDEHRALHAHLAALPAAQRDAIALRFGAGLTAREIGLVLGKGEAATQKLISRGMARLREVYRDEH